MIAQQSAPIVYSLPTIATVSLGIFNIIGQAVAVLLHERTDAGQYQATWNANVPSGICFSRLQVGHFLETKKMVAVTYHERRVAKAVFTGLDAIGTRLRKPYDAFLWGIPLVWQSVHPTKWMLCGLLLSANVVFILVTSRPQFEIAG